MDPSSFRNPHSAFRNGLARRVAYCLAAFTLCAVVGCPKPQLVLYCAQDEDPAKGILASFKQETGIEVTPKPDTEADKSVSLYQEIVREQSRPRCDVFWNNEILSTIRLQKQGLLLPYDSPSAKPYAESEWAPKTKDHTWHAFATRARVLIVNTDLVPEEKERPKSLLDLADEKWKGQAVMARPLFGTTATQAACLFEVMGKEDAEKYYHALKENGIHIAPGNSQVARWVADGKTPSGERVAVGVTDTDDAMAMVKAKKKVALIFPDREGSEKYPQFGTLYIPNTVAILKNASHPEAAKRLVDYLLSPEVEARLAEGDMHQIPLNPDVKAKLPEQIVTPDKVKKTMQVDFFKAAEMWDEVQDFLRKEFATK
jgi:iron(III) transport system substrate-binding protein